MSNLSQNLASELFTDVPNTAIPPVKNVDKISYLSDYKTDFLKASIDFWIQKNPRLISSYNKGNFLGKHNVLSLEVLLKLIFNCIIETIKSDVQQNNNGIQSITLKSYFDTLNDMIPLLTNYLNQHYPNSINIDKLIATLHGTLNAYIENTHPEENKSNN